jgi:hypothetical protein
VSGPGPGSAARQASNMASGNEQDGFAAFDRDLLRALRDLAVRSPRAQADLQAALFRANLHASPDAILASLARLVQQGLVFNVIRLQDGGTLVTVRLTVS